MARSLRIQYPGAFYHVTCRGNERKKVFLDDDDRHRFTALLAESLETYQVVLYAYIMMANHFHLLVQTLRANLSEFMRRFNICYTGWFNYHHGRCGHLYQGRYKAFLIDADNYLLELSRYLHLNYVRASKLRSLDYERRWQYVKAYHWSSLPGYLNKKDVVDFIDYDMVLSMVDGRRSYRAFMADGLKHDVDSPFNDLKKGLILGDDNFVARVKSEYVETGSLRDQPSYRGLMAKVIEPDFVIGCVANALGINKERLLVRFGNGIARGIVSELLYRYSSLTQREIGRLLGGIDYSAVNKLRFRLYKKMAHDKKIAGHYAKAENKIQKPLSNVEI
jgi:REP element-mobilizing transposase RayT